MCLVNVNGPLGTHSKMRKVFLEFYFKAIQIISVKTCKNSYCNSTLTSVHSCAILYQQQWKSSVHMSLYCHTETFIVSPV